MYCQPSSSQFNESLTDDFINVGILKFTDLRKVVIVVVSCHFLMLTFILSVATKGQEPWSRLLR